MKKSILLGSGVGLILVVGLALAEPGDPPMPPGPGGPGGPPPPPGPGHLIIVTVDADHDRTISAEEIADAAAALLSLDTNGDGALTPDELRPPPPAEAPQHQPGERLMALDTDGDGLVSLDEFTAPAVEAFSRIDVSGDGFIDQAEAQAAPPPPGPRPPRALRSAHRQGQ